MRLKRHRMGDWNETNEFSEWETGSETKKSRRMETYTHVHFELGSYWPAR